MQSVEKSYLIIDDDYEFASQLARALERRNNTANYFVSSQEALEETKHSPDRIILDLRLKGEHGIEVLKQLKATFPTAEVVLLTGYGTIPTAIEAIKNGAIHFLSKPATIEEILNSFENERTIHEDHNNTEPQTLTLQQIEWEHIDRVLSETDGNISQAARLLGLHRRSLQRKLASRNAYSDPQK